MTGIREAEPGLLAGSERVPERHDVQRGAVLGLERLAVQRPAQVLPRRVHRHREARHGAVGVVDDLVPAANLERVPGGVQVHGHVHARELGHRGILPGLDVLGPVVLPQLPRGAALVAVVHAEGEQRAGHDGHQQQRGDRTRPGEYRARPQRVDESRRVALAPLEQPHGEHGEQHGDAQPQRAIQEQRHAVVLERGDVGPPEHAPQIPVPHPVHVAARLRPAGEDHDAESHRVGRVSIARHGLDRAHERGEQQERGHQQQPPHDHERHELQRHVPLEGEDAQAADQACEHDGQAEHGVRERLARQQRGGAQRRRVRDRAEARAALALQRFRRIEQDHHAHEQRERVHHADGERPRRVEQPGVERAHVVVVRQCLEQDEGHEQVEPGVPEDPVHLGLRHLERAGDEAGNAGAHAERGERGGDVAVRRDPSRKSVIAARRPSLDDRLRPAGPAQRGGEAALQHPHRPEAQGHAREALDDHQRVEPDAGAIVEVHALVHVEPDFLQPAQPGEIHELEHPVHLPRQPHRRPFPEEEHAHHEHGDGKEEHQHGPSREPTDGEARAAEEHQRRQREHEGGSQVAHQPERADVLRVAAVRHQVVERHHEREVEAERRHERGQHGDELAPHVLARLERRRVQQLAHLGLVVADQRHARGHGGEEHVDETRHEDEQLTDRELGVDERLVASDAGVARGDGRVPGADPIGEEAEDHELHPEERPARVEPQLLPEHLQEPRGAHDRTAAGSPSGATGSAGGAVASIDSTPGSSPRRMSTR